MPVDECPVCSSRVVGFEGDRGIFIGRCRTCGWGINCATDEDRMEEWEKAEAEKREHLWKIITERNGITLEGLPFKASEDDAWRMIEGFEWGTHIILYDMTEGRAVCSFRVTMRDEYYQTPEDRTFIEEERRRWQEAML